MTITAGDTVHREGNHARVHKRDLAGLMQVLLQSGRLLVAEALPLAATLREAAGLPGEDYGGGK